MTHVLFVCTANRCRSPIAEALLRQRLPRRSSITVASAGFLAAEQLTPPAAQNQVRRFGIDLSEHRSTQVSDALLAQADLVLVMERAQLRRLIARNASDKPKEFTVKDFVRRANQFDGPPTRLRALATRLDAERPSAALLGVEPDDDIVDPMGKSRATWAAVTREISAQVDALATLLVASSA